MDLPRRRPLRHGPRPVSLAAVVSWLTALLLAITILPGTAIAGQAAASAGAPVGDTALSEPAATLRSPVIPRIAAADSAATSAAHAATAAAIIDSVADTSGPDAEAAGSLLGASLSSAASSLGIAAAATSAAATSPPGPASTVRNHVVSVALGLDQAVAAFPCSRSRPPDMLLYRWGCAGANNVYLLAHAAGPFRHLHDLYERGGLRRGMTVDYNDGSGGVHRYRVVWWRTTLPTDGAWAFAASSTPVMTLQTCVGAGDRYRLIVRLVEVS